MSQDKSLLGYTELINEVRALCTAGKSGTVLIATQDNQLSRILLEDGRITGLAVGLKQGMAAIPFLRAIKAGRMKFSESRIGSHEEGQLPATPELLQLLGTGKAKSKDGPAASTTDTPADAAMKLIEAELIEFLGPMASIVWAEHVEKMEGPVTGKSIAALIDTLAKEIGDPGKISRFKERIEKKLKNL